MITPDLKEQFARLARVHGDMELLQGCLWLIQEYATVGARRALTKRRGPKDVDCEVCRERAALASQYEETLKRTRTHRPQGGAAPSQMENGDG